LGGAGDDSLVGSEGDDMLDGGAGADALHGDLGDDALRGGADHDTLFGGWGDDILSGFEDDPGTDGWNDTDVSDYLNGGGGDDLITAGAGDIVTGGAGADTILLGEWLSADHQAQILDFKPDEDTLMIVFNDLAGAEPDVDLAADPDNEGIQHIMLNGVAIAAVNNAAGLNAGHITLIGSSLLPAGAVL
jgi:Ca2+-binding RTX toxin-like protein